MSEETSPRRRRYDICQALNMTRLSIQLELLEGLGVEKRVLSRWRDRANHLLQDILDVSDSIAGK